jgi:hypothetical protein
MNIIEMARLAGIKSGDIYKLTVGLMSIKTLERFTELVRADEREACCAIVYGLCESDNVAQRTVDAIQARGNT